MKTKVFRHCQVLAFIFILVPMFVFAQDGSTPETPIPETPMPETPIPETPMPKETPTVLPETATPTPSPAGAGSSVSRTVNPSPATSTTATPLPSPTPNPSGVMPAVYNTPVEGEITDINIWVIVGAGGGGLIGLASLLIRNKIKNKTNNLEDGKEGKCDSIKELLEQKKKELEEFVKNYPEDRLKKMIEDSRNKVQGEVVKELKKNEDIKKVIETAENLKKKHDQLKKTIEMLQKKYDLCMLEFPSGKNKKRVFIIHGWEGRPDQHWLPWLKVELEKKGFAVAIPQMPDTDYPKIESWLSHLGELVGKSDEDTYFVGHSIGCQAIIRYLETLDNKVGGFVLVAGFLMRLMGDLNEEEKVIAKPWIETPINYEKVKENCPKITAIFSDNDEFINLDNVKLFENNLNAKTLIEHNKGHFTAGDGVSELPSALKSVLDMASDS